MLHQCVILTKQCWTSSSSVVFSGPLSNLTSDDMFSRMSSFTRWLSRWCLANNLGTPHHHFLKQLFLMLFSPTVHNLFIQSRSRTQIWPRRKKTLQRSREPVAKINYPKGHLICLQDLQRCQQKTHHSVCNMWVKNHRRRSAFEAAQRTVSQSHYQSLQANASLMRDFSNGLHGNLLSPPHSTHWFSKLHRFRSSQHTVTCDISFNQQVCSLQKLQQGHKNPILK